MTKQTIISIIIILLAGVGVFYVLQYQPSSDLSSDRVMQPYGKLPANTQPAPSADEIVGTTWVWSYLLVGGDGMVAPNQPGKFTLTFGTDGRAFGTTDCNSFNGSYTLGSDGIISFGPFASTMMYCEGSQESAFTSELAQASRLSTDSEGNLVMTLGETSNILVFAKQ